jgi:glycosyltransferase involved in cell wall biosynthesis
MPSPDVTVVIPAHGPGPYLAEAVASALAEEPADVLVVEDGTEGVDEASLGGARLLRLPHVRRSRARNAGVEAAATPYVAFLDEDDRCLPGRLALQRAALEREGAAVMTFGRVHVIRADGATDAQLTSELAARFDQLVRRGPDFAAVAELGGPLYTSATMVRRAGFLESGGFDAAFDAYEDLDLYLRLARERLLVPTGGDAVSDYRVHGANTPSDALYRASLGVSDKHLPSATGRDRRALLARRVEALWGLGEFARARGEALRAVAREPQLLAQPRFAKRLAGLLLPTRLLAARR